MILDDWLYLGTSFDAAEHRLRSLHIDAVLNVKGGGIPAYLTPKVTYKCKPLCDYGRSDLSLLLPGIARFLSAALARRHKVLVHCHLACNRSPTTVLLFMLCHLRMPLAVCGPLLLARHPRASPHPSYLAQLHALEPLVLRRSSLSLPQLAALFSARIVPPSIPIAISPSFCQPVPSLASLATVAVLQSGSARAADRRAGRGFVEALRGVLLPEDVVVPGMAEYHGRRQLWNGMLDRRPSAVVSPRDAHQVAEVVRLAAAHGGVRLCVRGGGHSVSGLSCQDGAVVVDLRHFRGASYDGERLVVRVGGGATWRRVDEALEGRGRGCVAGLIAHTGVGGLSMGGGIGWLSRLHGLACDSLVGVEMVSGRGEVVEMQGEGGVQDELMFGMRGAGANFGIVTQFTFRTHPIYCVLLSQLLWAYCPESRGEILKEYEAYCLDPSLPTWASNYAWITLNHTLLCFVDIVEHEEDFKLREADHNLRVSRFSKKSNPTLDYPLEILSFADLNSVC